MTQSEAKPAAETSVDDLEEARLDAQSEVEIDDGQGVPHARVREWLARLGQGEDVPRCERSPESSAI